MGAIGNTLFVYGGVDGVTGHPRDVWKSTDGASWQLATAQGDWAQRVYSTGTAFNGRI